MKQCTRCGNEKNDQEFLSVRGKVLKRCSYCRNYDKIQKQNNKCLHNRQQARCKECGGASICSHNRERRRCKDCGGASICPHKRIKNQCKECEGTSICQHNRIRSICKKCNDPIKITILNMIRGSKQWDIQHNYYDADHHIDKFFIKQLIDESINCYYCKVQMQFIDYNDILCTIERVDSHIGHIKSNCVLACKRCNLLKVGSQKRLLINQFKRLNNEFKIKNDQVKQQIKLMDNSL
jgi:hypothetical protein